MFYHGAPDNLLGERGAARPQSAKAARRQERRVSVCCENKLLINSGNNPNEETGELLRASGLKTNIYPR